MLQTELGVEIFNALKEIIILSGFLILFCIVSFRVKKKVILIIDIFSQI